MGFIGFLFNPKISQPAFSGTKDENNQQESRTKTLLVSILPPSSWSFQQSDSPDAGEASTSGFEASRLVFFYHGNLTYAPQGHPPQEIRP